VLITSFVSAFYSARLFVLVFVAPAALEREVHESPAVMVVPLALLAAGALAFGGLVTSGLLPIGSGRPDEAPLWLTTASFAIAVGGFSAGWAVYRHGLARALPVEAITDPFAEGFGVDRLYRAAFVGPFVAISGELEGGAERANQLALDGIASLTRSAWAVVRRAQGGYVRGYEAILLAGAVALLAYWNWSAR